MYGCVLFSLFCMSAVRRDTSTALDDLRQVLYEWSRIKSCVHLTQESSFLNFERFEKKGNSCYRDQGPVLTRDVQEWTEWPETHHGPVIDYLANCNGPCETTDKSSLKFNKIDAVGLLEQSTGPGTAGSWGSDRLRIRNNTWTVTIPSTIAEGSYVLRHEIIALHSARTVNGAQNYPHCINLQVTGSGADKLSSGTLGTALYKPGEPGIQVDIYRPLQYQMPGPPLYTTGTSASGATTADSGLGGGLDNMGMGGGVSASISVASQTMSTASSAAANAVSASISVYTSTTSPLATTTPFATASAPYSNSTGSNTTMTMSYSPITSSISIAAASSSPLPIPEALQTAVSLVNNVSQATESIQVNEAAAQTTYPSTSAQMPAATTPTATSSPLDIPVQQATSAAAAATTSATSKTYPSLPLNPTPALLSGMSVSELMLYLKAIVAELSNKLSTNQSKRRRHARDVISSR